MEEFYLEIVAFHIVSVLSLMAVLFYMPRLFVYHVENIDKEILLRLLKFKRRRCIGLLEFQL